MRKLIYRYKLVQDSKFLKIQYDMEINPFPDLLCKYYSLNERNVSALISNKVFASNPDLLNDLFDTLFLNLEVNQEHIAIFKVLVENTGDTFEEKKFNESNDYRIQLRNTLFAIWNSKIGIISTTDDPYNDLMWAHYANNEGFLLEFDYRKFPKNFGDPIPVSYLENEEFHKNTSKNLIENLFINALKKKEIWQYENEYRFLVHPRQEKSFLTSGRFSNEDHLNYPKESRLQEYSKDCIKRIILGFNFFFPIMISNTRIDFSKPTGLLRKVIIDYALQDKITLESLSLDYKKMVLIPRSFELVKISNLEFEVNYTH